MRKLGIYAIGFVLGCLILLALPKRERTGSQRAHWHDQTAPEGTYPMTVVDDLGRAVTLERQPRTFVSLAPSVTELLFAMDMGDHLVAVTQWCDHPEEARALRDAGAHVGSIDQPSRETIAALRPDLVIGTDFTPPEVYAAIERPPRTVAVALRHDSMEDILDDTRLLGRILGVPGKALQLILRLQAERAAVVQRLEAVAEENPRRVLFLLSVESGGQPGWAPGKGTWIASLIEAAHAENLASSLGSAWGELSFEALLALDPEVLLVRAAETPAGQTRLAAELAKLPNHPVWRQVRAVRDGRVHLLPYSPLTVPGPRIMQAYAEIAEAIW